jgi:hypothetical protein
MFTQFVLTAALVGYHVFFCKDGLAQAETLADNPQSTSLLIEPGPGKSLGALIREGDRPNWRREPE